MTIQAPAETARPGADGRIRNPDGWVEVLWASKCQRHNRPILLPCINSCGSFVRTELDAGDDVLIPLTLITSATEFG